MHKVFSIIARKLTVVDRIYQVWLVDDEKEYFKLVSRSARNQITIKKVKSTRYNRHVHTADAMTTRESQLETCEKYEESG